MTKLRPAFDKEGSVTAGNASGINDGAAAVVLASQKAVDEKGFKPMGRIIGWGHAGVEPSIMGVGPVKAVPIAIDRKRVVWGQGVSVRVDLGGRRTSKKKK